MSFDDNIFDGELVLPTGGWSLRQLHLTNDDLPAFAVQRGGIKYPKPQEAPMGAKRKALERELKAAQELRESLDQRIPELQAELAKAPVLAPPQGPNKFRVNVTFGPKGKRYEFLLLKTPDGRWFTTGTKPETAEFRSWHKLVEWLEGPEVHWHSDLDVLGADGRAYSFAEGKIVDAGEGDPVF